MNSDQNTVGPAGNRWLSLEIILAAAGVILLLYCVLALWMPVMHGGGR
jgi:hypothetical protein